MSRNRHSLAAFGVALLIAFAAVGATPAAAATVRVPAPAVAAAIPNPCDTILGTVGPGALPCGALDLAGDALGVIGGIGGEIAEGVIDAFAGWIASGLASLLETVGHAIFSGTEVDLFASGESGPWFLQQYGKMAAIGLAIFAPMLLLAVLHAVLSQSWGLLTRALANLPIATLGTAVAVTVTQLLLAATDSASTFMASGLAADSQNFLDGVISTLANPAAVVGTGGASMFGVIFVGLFLAFVAFVVWLELLVREAAIFLTVLFLPLGFATHIWPALSAWLRRLVEVIVALILSKLVIVAALALAGGALANQEGFAALVGAAGMMMLAAFAPFALFKLIPIASLAATSSLEGQGRRAVRAGTPRLSTAYYLGNLGRSRQAAGRPSALAASTAGPTSDGGRPGGPPPPTLGPSGGSGSLPGSGGGASLPRTGAGAGTASAGAVGAGAAAAGVGAAAAGAGAAASKVRDQGRKAVDANVSTTEQQR